MLDLREQLAVHYSAAGQSPRGARKPDARSCARTSTTTTAPRRRRCSIRIASLGKGDPLAAEYQRKLFSLLY
jgi:putative thioredoxin